MSNIKKTGNPMPPEQEVKIKNVKKNEVPDKVIIKYLIKEKQNLLNEIERLKATIALREEGIKAFKRWQSKVAERKWMYWLNEGIKLMETPPDRELQIKLKNIYTTDELLKKKAKACLLIFEKNEWAKKALKTELEKIKNEG